MYTLSLHLQSFDRQIQNLTGDILIAAGALAYLGAFTSAYREELLGSWIDSCVEQDVPITPGFSLISTLADAYEIRCWNGFGLPRDQVSTENAVLVTQAGKWPLMIDPQEQVYVSPIHHFHSERKPFDNADHSVLHRQIDGYVIWSVRII